MCSIPPRELPIFQGVIGVLNLKCFPLGAGVFSGKEIRIGKKVLRLKQGVSGYSTQMDMLCFIESTGYTFDQ